MNLNNITDNESEKPDEKVAYAMLEYISWENKILLNTVNLLAGEQLSKYFKWVDEYAFSNNCTQEDVIKLLIDKKI